MRSTPLGLLLVAVVLPVGTGCRGSSDEAEDVIRKAIAAHGGEDKLSKTLKGRLRAKAKGDFPMDQTGAPIDATFEINWDETFDLPGRYKRDIYGEMNGQSMSMQYAVTDGKGWIRQSGGTSTTFEGQPIPIERHWHATLATLPMLLGNKECKLSSAGKATVNGREAVAIKVLNLDEEVVLFFDQTTGLLMKSKKKMPQFVLAKDVDAEVVYDNYKQVSGVQYPMKVTAYSKDRKIMEVEITEIEFLDSVEDQVFARPPY